MGPQYERSICMESKRIQNGLDYYEYFLESFGKSFQEYKILK